MLEFGTNTFWNKEKYPQIVDTNQKYKKLDKKIDI
jgi:hypothetical protein